jgi:TIR domain
MAGGTDAGHAQRADTLFLSYTHEEAPMAEAIVTTLKENFDNLNIFDWKSTEHVSADWLEKLKFELGQAKAVVFLLSPDSIRKQWILFEYGASWFSAGNKLLIPIFHSKAFPPTTEILALPYPP